MLGHSATSYINGKIVVCSHCPNCPLYAILFHEEGSSYIWSIDWEKIETSFLFILTHSSEYPTLCYTDFAYLFKTIRHHLQLMKGLFP